MKGRNAMHRDYWPTADWEFRDPATLKMDPEKLAKIDPALESEYGNIVGIVVVKNGYIAYERYCAGHGPDDRTHVASVTKSVLSALIGIAIDARYIENTDQKVLDFFPEYAYAADGRKREITIRHLLTMTVPYPFDDWHEPLDTMCEQPDWGKYILDMLGRNGSIGTFKYSTAGAHLLSAIITRSTGKSAREFANERLFGPIGMEEIPDHAMAGFGFDDLFGKNVRGWVKDPKGNSTGGWGLTLSPRDMARFGFLYLNRGTWDGNRVVSPRWIDESTSPHSGIPGIRYGYLWWLREEDGLNAYLALGDGGNVICCIPQKDLVISIASSFILAPHDRWTLIKEHILPAVME
jgi:CubicO group peptidase (beta-lactamase class C family)